MESLEFTGQVLWCIFYTIPPLLIIGVTYRLLAHPLRKYPGPLFGSLTDAYAAYFACKQTLHLATWKSHIKYGPVIRLAPNRLVFNTATALRDIYQNDRVTKPPVYLATQGKKPAHSIWNALDRNLHRRRRQLVGRAITDAAMREFEPVMKEQVDIFIRQLASGSGQPVNMKYRCSFLSFDIVGLLAFGYPLNLQTDKENQFLVDLLAQGNYRMNTYMQIPFIPRNKLQVYINLLFHQEREKTSRLMERMIRSRMVADVQAKRDLYSFLAPEVNAKDDDALRLGDIWYEAFFFIIAGGDTSATTLSALFFYLSRNRECYDRLAGEIRKAFQTGEEIRSGRFADIPYLRACIDEALRMSPPVPGTLWRHLAPEEEGKGPLIVDGHVIPKGTEVGVNIYSLHHNQEYFEDPFKFKPERWLTHGASKEWSPAKKTMHDAFAAFSAGPRGCAGKATAYMEISLTLAKTLWYFDFKSAPGALGDVGEGQKGEFHIHDIFTSTHDGPYIVFEQRDTS